MKWTGCKIKLNTKVKCESIHVNFNELKSKGSRDESKKKMKNNVHKIILHGVDSNISSVCQHYCW
jgi:hypothetical protein